MSEMVERVARAIAEDNENWPYDRRPWSEQRHLLERARASIAAMREPTEAMLDEGVQGEIFNRYALRHSWQAMIDSALTPSPPHQG